MIFKPQNFRRLGKDSNPPTIREAGTLIIVKASGETAYARTKGDKDHVVSHFDEKRDLLLWAWIGERYTDIFQLTKDDLVTHGGFQLTKDDLVKRASGLGFRGVLHIAAGDARVKDQVARASAATRIEREEGGMEQRAFFDVLEYWAGPMTPGSVAGFDGLVRVVASLDDQQRAMMVRYLRLDITYERFLQTRYWHAIRLKVISDRKYICDVCIEKHQDVEVHHRTYDHRGEEFDYLTDLRLLCARCHNIVHEVKAMAQTK